MTDRSRWLPVLVFTALALVVVACAQPAVTSVPPADQPSAGDQTEVTEASGMTGEASEQQPAEVVQGTVWVANGLEDNLSAIDLTTHQVVATVSAGVNPHILDASPDGQMLHVINAGAHDREPGALGGAEGSEMGPSDDLDQQEDYQGSTDAAGGMISEQQTRGAGHGGDMGMDTDRPAAANSLWAIDAASGQVLARVAAGRDLPTRWPLRMAGECTSLAPTRIRSA